MQVPIMKKKKKRSYRPIRQTSLIPPPITLSNNEHIAEPRLDTPVNGALIGI